MQNTFAYIDQHFDGFIEELRTLVRQPSISAQNIGLRECAGIVVNKFESLGMETQVWETSRAPVIFARMKGAGDKTLLFYNHYDVQPPEPLEEWNYEPFGAELDDGRMYGRGTADNKGSLYSRIHALEAFLKTNHSLPATVAFLVEGDEESGSTGLRECIDDHHSELNADLCIWENSYRDLNGYPEVRLGNKGILPLEFTVETSKVDFHSGFAPVIPNAAWRLITALSTFKDEKDHILIDGFYDGVEEIDSEELAALKQTPSVEEELKTRSGRDSLINGITGYEVNRRLFTEPTFNISGFISGYVGMGSKTVLPKKAMARVDMRMVLGQDPDKIRTQVRKHLDKHGFMDVEISSPNGKGAVWASKTPVSTPYLAIMKKAVGLVTDKPLRVFTTSPGTGPRDLFSRWTDMPILSSGAGNAHSKSHAPNENIILEDYREETKIMAALISLVNDLNSKDA